MKTFALLPRALRRVCTFAVLAVFAAGIAREALAYGDGWLGTDDPKVGIVAVDASTRAYVFTNAGAACTFSLKRTFYVPEILAVAGGGSGGGVRGGGGGAGGLTNVTATLAAGLVTSNAAAAVLSVGAGGARIAVSSWGRGNKGSPTTFAWNGHVFDLEGGGSGGGWNDKNGGTGACGGGATQYGTGAAGTTGGKGGDSPSNQAGGGGGGVMGDGAASSGGTGGDGGAGFSSSITGTSVVYGLGGKGGWNASTAQVDAPDGVGQGGMGGLYGGGGNVSGGRGGCGAVIVRLTTAVADSVIVSASPSLFASDQIAYGPKTDVASGTSYTFTAPSGSVYLNDAHTAYAQCTGWLLYRFSDWTVLRSSADGGESATSCTLSYSVPVALEWQWKTVCKCTATATGSGTVSVSEAWVEGGKDFTVTATPAAGNILKRWVVNGVASGKAATLSVTVADEPLVVEAVFASATCTWTGAGSDNLASNEDNWSGSVPFDGADVVLDGANAAAQKAMTWDLASVKLGSWTQEGYTNVVTFQTTYDTYSTTLTNVTITGNVRLASGTWTHITNQGIEPKSSTSIIVQYYRLMVTIGGNLTIATNATTGVFGKIDVSGKGRNRGPGSAGGDRGGSYGGSTSDYPNNCWGTTFKRPSDVGAGAHNMSIPGGGAVWIDCTGDVKIDGLIQADGILGSDGYRSSSGGAIYVKGKTVKGAGRISASGCQKKSSHGQGGGGRIALYATDAGATQSDFIANVVALESISGNTSWYHACGGTVYTETAADGGRGILTVDTLLDRAAYVSTTVRDRTALLPAMQNELDTGLAKIVLKHYAMLGVEAGVTLDLSKVTLESDSTSRIYLYGTIKTPATYEFQNVTIHAVDSVPAIDNATLLTIGSGANLETGTVPMSFAGSLAVGSGGKICHYGAAGNSIDLTIAGDLTVAANGKIDATNCGRNSSTDQGFPTSSLQSGSSHGGRGHPWTNGGSFNDFVTPCWGSIHTPTNFGANSSNGSSGGRVRLAVAGNTTVDGIIASVGGKGDWHGGSGGSIILATKRLTGSGSIQASGGWGWNRDSAGGGGRIALTLTEAGRTFADFSGVIANFGRWQKGSGASQYETSPGANVVRGGAGSTYLRTAGDAVDAGELIYDQLTTLAKTDAYATSEITADMPDKDYGKVLVRNGARLVVTNGAEISCSVWSNASSIAFAPTAKLTLVPDADGNAYVWGSTAFSNFAIDPSVKIVYFEAGATNTFTASFTATGSDESHRIKLRSTQSGGKYYFFKTESSAVQNLDFLDVEDSDATPGVQMVAQHSICAGGTSKNWKFINIVPGTAMIWTGGANDLWGDAANWAFSDSSPAERTPVASDHVTIPVTSRDPVLPQSEVTVSNLTVATGATLTMNGYDLTVAGDFTLRGTFAVTDTERVTLKGAVDFTDGSTVGAFVPQNGEVVIANDYAKTLDFGGTVLTTLRFANGAPATVAGSFTATYLRFDAGSSVKVDPAASVTATALYVTGEDGRLVSIRSTTDGQSYVFAVPGYAEVAWAIVYDADSSSGETIYASNTTGARTKNWSFTDTRKVWKGTTSTAFATASNWADGTVPEDGADIVIATNAANVMAITTADVTIGSLTVLAQGFSTTQPLLLTKSLVMLAGTATVNRKVTIGSSLLMFTGSKITHLEQGAGKSTLQNWCELDVAGDALITAGASIDADGRGYRPGCGPGYRSGCGGCYGGTSGRRNTTDVTGFCYGSVFAPADCGSGGIQGGNAGGLVILKVAGTLTLNGTVTASGSYTTSDSKGASGGGVNIRAGALVGSGKVQANGERTTGNCFGQGGGGRIALVLTKKGSDFSGFLGTVESLGGWSSRQGMYGGSGGTVYRQAGDEADGTGTVRTSNGTAYQQDDSNQNRKWAGMGLGFAGSDDLSRATVELGASSGIFLHGDARIGKLVFLDERTSSYPAMINFNTNYTLTVRQQRPDKSEWTEGLDKYKFNAVHNGTISYDGATQLKWLHRGMTVIYW